MWYDNEESTADACVRRGLTSIRIETKSRWYDNEESTADTCVRRSLTSIRIETESRWYNILIYFKDVITEAVRKWETAGKK